MKWNVEWVDLQNIERMIAECWRLGGRQLEKYCMNLSRQQDLAFAGELGLKFLEMMMQSIEKEEKVDWSNLQRDIRLMKELIQDGYSQSDFYWRSQYQVLTADTAAYFQTEFGVAFTAQLGSKLGLDMSEEQRMLQHDIQKIQKLCASCDWGDDDKAKQALMLLTKEEKYYFSSWLGDGFVKILEERFGTKEEAPEAKMMEDFQEVRHVSKKVRRAKIAWTIAVCVIVALLGIGLYFMQSQGMEGREKLLRIFSKKTAASAEGGGQGGPAALQEQGQMASQPLGQAQGVLNTKESGQSQDGKTGIGESGQQKGKLHMAQDGQEAGSDSSSPSGQEAGTGADSQGDRDVSSRDGINGGEVMGNLDADTANTGFQAATEELPEILPKYKAFHKRYPDLFGWLEIPGTEINHPVMQSDDEKRGEKYYYLHRDYTGKESEAGSLFVESKSSIYPQDANTVIYGHNMSNGHNFGMLEKYKDYEFYQNHQNVQYDTVYETGEYQIAAVLISRILYQEEEGFRYYRFYNYSTEDEFQECIDFIRENQLYDTGMGLQYGDKLLMLSTCEYSSPNGRLVIVAKKIG